MSLGSGALVLAAGLTTALSTSCRGRDVEFDCEYSRDQFDQEIDGQGELRDEISTKAPFAAAMVLTAEGVDRLLGSTAEELPFTGTIPFGPSSIDFEPDGAPTIEVADVPGCSNCILYSVDFLVELGFGTSDISSGTGNAKLAVPIVLEPGEGGKTNLVAAYEESEMEEFEVTVYGLDSEEYEGMASAISVLMEESLKEEFGPTTLLEFEPIGLGDGEVELAARELISFPEANALALGLGTNLKLPKGAGLDIQPELTEDIPMSLQFDPDLLLAMSQRMLAEGNIPQFYDKKGNPDSDGELAATIEDVEGTDSGDARLDTTFRVWRLEGGFCGYAEANLPLFVELDGENCEAELPAASCDIKIVPGNVEVIRGKGIGSLAAEEDQVVADNQHLLDNFRGAVAHHMGLTVNYDSLSIEGKAIYFTTKGVEVAPGLLKTELDFVVVELEAP
jgi:hypothetical protein